jgi:competence protein ComEC
MSKKYHLILWVFIISSILFRYITTQKNITDGTKIRIADRVSNDPIRYDYNQRILLANYKIYLPAFPEVNYGDEIIVEGNVDGDELTNPVLIEIKQSSALLYKLRKRLLSFYQQNLPEPHAALVAGLVLGSKSSIPSGFWDDLKLTGTAHVVVASGMNASLIAGFLMSVLLLIVPRRRAVLLAIAGIWVYAALIGFEAPIVRASVMVSLAFLATVLGRIQEGIKTLFYSAGLMLMVKPLWIFDVGFILSFSATLSLMLFEKQVNRRLKFVPGVFREGLSTSLAAQVLVAPILFVSFGQLSLMSPITNALVLWIVPIVTYIGMIAGLMSLVWWDLARFILMLAYPLTIWFVKMVEMLAI